MSLIDLKNINKPIIKLLDVIQNSIGTLYRPTKIKTEAKAQAQAEIYKKFGEIISNEMNPNAIRRLVSKENKRQMNIENIIKYSIEESRSLKNASSEKPDPDLITEFFNSCQDISNEEVQKIWGKLLANEVDKPGSIQRRTLNTLKLISSKEAQWFNQFCTNIVKIDFDVDDKEVYYSMIYHMYDVGDTTSISFSGVKSFEIQKLEEIGLITVLTVEFEENEPFSIHIGEEKYKAKTDVNFDLYTYTLSIAGEDLFKALEISPNNEYLNLCKDFLYKEKEVVVKE